MAECLLCHGALTIILDFGLQPLANRLRTLEQLSEPEPRYPLRFARCTKCGHFQLADRVDPSILFGDYKYASGVAKGWKEHCRALVKQLGSGQGRTALEIGSNDNTMVRALQGAGYEVLAVDPAGKGNHVIPKLWSTAVAQQHFPTFVLPFSLQQDVIIAQNVLGHVPDPIDFLKGIAIALKPDGVCIIEVPYVGHMLRDGEYPQIYHEHMSYWSTKALQGAAKQTGLTVTACEWINTHGGSARYTLRHGTEDGGFLGEATVRPIQIEAFTYKVASHREEFGALCRSLADKTVWGYGASAKAMTLLNLVPQLAECLDGIVDDSPLKQDHYVPGEAHVMIADRMLSKPDVVLNLAWNWKADIEAKVRATGYTGPILSPFPT